MYANQEAEKLKTMQSEAYAAKCGEAPSGMLGGYATLDKPCRVGIRDRATNDLNRAIRESRKAESLRELSYLLDKNPEVARILDLMEMVSG